MLHYKFQLVDRPIGAFSGPAIMGAGGKCTVTAAGDPAKATLYNEDGTALSNPISLTRGSGEFWGANTLTAVDLFILTGEGFSVQLWSVGADEVNEIAVDRGNRSQMLILPISIDDQVSDNTEVDTGMDDITGMIFLPWPHLKVHTADATETLDVGTGEVVPADGGDADGLMSAVSLTNTGLVADVDGALITAITNYIAAGDSLTFTFSAGADTGEAYAFLPYLLMTTGTPTLD